MRLAPAFTTVLLLVTGCCAFELPCDPPCEQHGQCVADHGNLSCRCDRNWFGSSCDVFICQDQPELCGSGQCVLNPANSTSYLCSCPYPTLGDLCQYTAGAEICDSVNCSDHGICYGKSDNSSSHDCVCKEGYYGKDCQFPGSSTCDTDVVQNCHGHGTCSVFQGANIVRHTCTCDKDPDGNELYVMATNCETLSSAYFCQEPDPCRNNGQCEPLAISSTSIKCVCPPEWTGQNCTISFNVCEGRCRNGGTCEPVDGGHYFNCTCPPGFTGQECEVSIGTTEQPLTRAPTPPPFSCENGGTVASTGWSCECDPAYTGHRCELSNPCAGNVCSVHTQAPHCVSVYESAAASAAGSVVVDYLCNCTEGWGGHDCDLDLNECLQQSICHAGNCTNTAGGYYCTCPVGWTGQHCDVRMAANCSTSEGRDLCGEGGVCVDVEGGVSCKCKEDFIGETCQSQVCLPSCQRVSSDGRCDPDCDTAACSYDGLDCIRGSDPYSNCPSAVECKLAYMNGRCDVTCNRLECLYDGFECIPPKGECPKKADCEADVEDGLCQPDCLTVECPYDFQDCRLSSSRNLLRDRLVFTLVSRDGRHFTSPWVEEFLGNLSQITNSLAVLEDVWQLTGEELKDVPLPSPTPASLLVYRVVVRLDITGCTDQCPQNAEEGLDKVRVAIAAGAPLGPYSVDDVYVEEPPPGIDLKTIVTTVAVLGVLLVGAVVVVIALGKRRKIRAKIWRPTSPSDADHASPSSQSGSNGVDGAMATITKEDEAGMYIEMGTKKAKMDTDERHVEWVDDTVPLSSDPASPSKQEPHKVVIGQSGRDTRQWTLAHARDVGRLVEQYRRQNGTSPNVNTPGPGGFTPLMLAVMRRPGAVDCIHYQSRSSSESSTDDQTALLPTMSRGGTPRHMVLSPVDRSVPNLVEAKADLDAVNDYNQTALQLAAAASRPEYVDLLLEAGANPNIPDNWGQTALHTSIGAGAEGAFMVLLNCPRTKVNVKCDGGITPLMAAVKMISSFMVKQLLKKDSEVISSTDNEGRTAVHWSAMVDNYEALRMLISRGPDTIKDAQDNKGQTALFLACREGSFLCVKHLLDCFANVTLLDHLDQSPVQISMQKQYTDIVELLRASAHGPMPYMRQMPPGSASYTYSPNGYPPTTQQQLVTPPTSKKKKRAARTQSPTSFPASSAVSHASPPDQYNHTSSAYSNPTPPGGYSNPTPPGGYSNPTPPGGYSNPTPPGGYSNPTPPGGYSNPTPPGGYSNPTPPSYEHHHSMQGEAELSSATTPTVSGATPLQHPYGPLYPSTTGSTDVVASSTRPLQHFSMVTDQPASFPHSEGQAGAYAYTGVPSPQSGGSVTQSSPHSVFPSPPNTNSPPSLTPSPEARQTNIHATGMVYVEGPAAAMGGVMGGVNFLPHNLQYQQHRHHQLTPV